MFRPVPVVLLHLILLISGAPSTTFMIFSFANDTMNASQAITYNHTLISAMAFYELGYFSPGGNSNNWYLGIWHRNSTPQTVVWVANREAPLRNRSSGVLRIDQAAGMLVLLNDTNHTIWSSNTSSGPRGGNNTSGRTLVIQLLDLGNLVLRDANDNRPREHYLWQSFDYPTDTFLPGMTFGINSVYLTSWKTDEDPSPGDYTYYLDPAGYPQLITKKSGVYQCRMGPWNSVAFSGAQDVHSDQSFTFGVQRNEEGQFYAREEPHDIRIMARVTLNTNGVIHRWRWVYQTQGWVPQTSIPLDNCDTYNICGAYGSCTVGNFPLCSCLDKFEPKDPKEWAESDWSTNGCIRRTPLNCTAGDGFVKYSNLKLPDARASWYDERMTLEECRGKCLTNCTCTAYATLNISGGGSGCLLYFGDLVDMKSISTMSYQDLYIRMAFSELDTTGRRNMKLIATMIIIGAVVLLGIIVVLCLWRKKKKGTGINTKSHGEQLELPLFDLLTISKATDGFTSKNKIGQGGYGPVYKGTLKDGQDIAVKRLSENSQQGLVEFRNEVIFVAKLQHRNLVKLLGYCLEGEEKMLIYEYMPNKSLDTVLFDPKSGIYLDWATRFRIVNGIAKGLMYLHEDSRLTIIHRDLKASNILLDSEMNPKISDFGIAKRCKGNETEVASQVVGTYGYMSPEYAVCGRYSTKSDVFSFGVIVLEILSGKRNNSYSQGDGQLNLLAHAWTLHKEGRIMEIVDSYLQKSGDLGQVLRLIHVGLLCAQQHPHDRPSMTAVVAMLSNDCEMPQPDYPGFYMKAHTLNHVSSNPESSTNEMTITVLGGR